MENLTDTTVTSIFKEDEIEAYMEKEIERFRAELREATFDAITKVFVPKQGLGPPMEETLAFIAECTKDIGAAGRVIFFTKKYAIDHLYDLTAKIFGLKILALKSESRHMVFVYDEILEELEKTRKLISEEPGMNNILAKCTPNPSLGQTVNSIVSSKYISAKKSRHRTKAQKKRANIALIKKKLSNKSG